MSTVASSQLVCARISDRLAKMVGERKYNMWFDRSARLDYHEEPPRLEVAVPNQFIADWIGRHFHRALRDAVRGEGGDQVNLDVRVDPQRFTVRRAETKTATRTERTERAPRHARQILRHRLESFVVGPSNELAYMASVQLAEDGGADTSNSLFIHGGCGLGKTHLLQGICRRALERRPGAAILYNTAEQFTNDFLTAVRSNRLEAFRARIRKLDLLAVDDVDFLANKQATQQEFLHSFDAIHLGGARLALASDNHPKLIRQFSEQLVSRCMRGMVVEVHPPDTETRVRVIRSLAAGRGLSLLDGVIDALASHCRGSIREIEGTLTRLHALASLAEQRCSNPGTDAQIGHALLNRLIHCDQDVPRKVVRIETIMSVVCNDIQVNRAQVAGSSRHRRIVLARSLVIHLARRMTSMSFPEIAAALDRRSHSTVVTAARRVEKQLSEGATVTTADNPEPVELNVLVERLHDSIRRA